MNHGQAPPANRTYFARAAGPGPCPIALGSLRFIDASQTHVQDVPQERGQLAAGVHLPIGQEGDEIEGCPAPVPAAPSEEALPLSMINEVEKVVPQPEDGILLHRFMVIFQENGIIFALRKLQAGPLADRGQAIKGEEAGPMAKDLSQGDDLIQVVLGESEHHHGINSHLPKDPEEFQGLLKMPLPGIFGEADPAGGGRKKSGMSSFEKKRGDFLPPAALQVGKSVGRQIGRDDPRPPIPVGNKLASLLRCSSNPGSSLPAPLSRVQGYTPFRPGSWSSWHPVPRSGPSGPISICS
jgi:hypothetical protein